MLTDQGRDKTFLKDGVEGYCSLFNTGEGAGAAHKGWLGNQLHSQEFQLAACLGVFGSIENKLKSFIPEPSLKSLHHRGLQLGSGVYGSQGGIKDRKI